MNDTMALSPKASPELVEKVARNISMIELYTQANARDKVLAKVTGEEKDAFLNNFREVVKSCWEGTTEGDEADKSHFRSLAMAALIATGYDVDIEDQVLKALLV